jgi:hypothetical protein
MATVFGATDINGLVAQLNAWAPQIEMQLQSVMGTAMVAEGRVQQLAEGGAVELRNIVAAFRAELDARTAARLSSDEVLKEELRSIVGQVHTKFLEVESAMERLRATTMTAPTTTASAPTASPAPTMPDPWAAAAAAARAGAGAGPPTGPTPTTPAAHGAGGGAYAGPSPPGLDSKYRVVHKNWGGHKLLDLDVNPDGFIAWRERALGFLTTDRPDVRKLLLWAERQPGTITEDDEVRGARETLMMEDVDRVSYVIFEAVKSIMTDALLARARACGEGRGLELWRRLHSEWRGSAPQVIAAKARRYQDPARCSDIKKLWEALPVWEQLGNEVVLAGYPVPDWVKAQALDKLIPQDMLATVVSRPELSDYGLKVKWVKAQMEHARGATLASQVSGKGHRDMDVGAVLKMHGDDSASEAPSSDSVIWSLQSELGRRSAEGDWDAVNALSGALFALGKGKSKGKSKGGGKDYTKGAPKGGYGKGGGKHYDEYGGKGKGYDGGKGGRTFEGNCNYCGKYGHRKSECKALDAEIARKGKGKGKSAYGLTGEEEYEDKDNKEDPPETPEEQEWWVGAVCALSREEAFGSPKGDPVEAQIWARTGSPSDHTAFVRVDPRRSVKPRLDKDQQPRPMKVQNMYAGLEQDDDEYEAAKEYQGNMKELEPDTSADVGDSTGRVPHTQAPRGTPARDEIGAWRPSLRGEPASRPPRVGAPPPRPGGFMGPKVKYEYKDGCSGACDLSRTIGGEPFSHRFRNIGGEPFSHPGVGSPSFGEDRKVSTHARKGTPPKASCCGHLSGLRAESEWPVVHGGIETRAMKRVRAAKRESSDSGEYLKTKVHGKDLDLLVSESGLDRFVGAVSKEHKDGKTRVVEAVVDSGAEESVAPPGCFPGAVVPSRMSRAGGKYRAANGARIPNLGQQRVPFVNEDGGKCGILFQIAEVERPLISATQLAASGNSVIITGKGGKIVNDKSGKVMRLTRRGGVLVLRMRIPAESGSGFPGPGR